MPKPKAQPTISPPSEIKYNQDDRQEPLSGSKNVKNKKHSRQKHGEGS